MAAFTAIFLPRRLGRIPPLLRDLRHAILSCGINLDFG
jgi:hypothetical protein